MDEKMRQEIALHRWAVIAEAANPRLAGGERGAVVRAIAAREHAHPDGTVRRYSRGTIDRWLRAWRGRRGGRRCGPRRAPIPGRCGRCRSCSPRPPRCGWSCRAAPRRRSPRSCITGTACGSPDRTVRGQLRRAGLHRAALKAAPKAYGRYEAERPNERWVTDVLVGPWVPYPKRDGSVRARLFLIVDDHSRLLADGRFFARENARACQELLRRAITRRGVPDILYCDNGAPFANAWLARTCAVLGIRLVHSKPYSPPLTGQSLDHLPVVLPQVSREPDRRCASCRPACRLDWGGSDPATGVPCLMLSPCRCREAGNAGGSRAGGGPATGSCATTTSATWPTGATPRPASAPTRSTCCTSPAGWTARTWAWMPWTPTRCCGIWPRAGPSPAPASTTTSSRWPAAGRRGSPRPRSTGGWRRSPACSASGRCATRPR